MGALALAGCKNASHPAPERRIMDWKSEDAVHEIVEPIPALPPPVTPLAHPALLFYAYTTNETWVPLERWCKSAGLAAPTFLSAIPLPTYCLNTASGNLLFSTGSQIAHWDQTELRLGFPPQWIDRQPYLHSLDLRKTLEPLISGGLFCSN